MRFVIIYTTKFLFSGHNSNLTHSICYLKGQSSGKQLLQHVKMKYSHQNILSSKSSSNTQQLPETKKKMCQC